MNKNQPYLLLGGGGMLGRAWRELFDREGLAYTAPTVQACNLADLPSMAKHVNSDLEAVVNCAAYTDVDGCETHEARATAINGNAVGHLADLCLTANVKLVHYSTDYVFDGRSKAPYPTNALRNPVNAYGRGKALGEELIGRSGCDSLIIRTSWLYAPWGKNFVRTIERLAAELPVLQVVDDQRGRPTSVAQLVENSFRLLVSRAVGTFHVTDSGDCSWFEFATEIVKQAGGDTRVEPCATAEFPRPAPRPAYSVLDVGKTLERIGHLNDWRSNLADCLQRLEPQTS